MITDGVRLSCEAVTISAWAREVSGRQTTLYALGGLVAYSLPTGPMWSDGWPWPKIRDSGLSYVLYENCR